jgi:hypothetical protein
MPALDEIPGIDADHLQLLEAAGIGGAEELAAQDTDDLVAELKRTNDLLSLAKRAPGKAVVMKWIAEAMELVDEASSIAEPEEYSADAQTDTPSESAVPLDYEANTEIADMLSRAPCAIPLPGKIMMEKGLRVSDVPAGLLLNRYSGDLDVRIGDPAPPKSDVPSRRRPGHLEAHSKQAARRHFDASSAKPIIPSGKGDRRVPASISGHEEDRVALTRAPRANTNRGKNPQSRRYVRGVLHTHPWRLRIGAFFTLLLLIHTPLAIISGLLLLASQENPESFEWVSAWFLVFPIALPVTGLGYVLWGLTGKCRICSHRLFVRNGALKHIKAHRFPLLGYVVPLCLHLLSFHWFRCSSCGTPVRLKK